MAALLADVRQEGHEPGPLDRAGHGMLTGSRAAALASAKNLALPVDELAQQLEVLVIDIHRTRTGTVDEDRIFPLHLRTGLGLLLGELRKLGIGWGHLEFFSWDSSVGTLRFVSTIAGSIHMDHRGREDDQPDPCDVMCLGYVVYRLKNDD